MADEDVQVDILLSTYNGARFLDQQIESLLGQTHANFRLLVRDDGSADHTPEILSRYAAQEPRRIELCVDGPRHLGVCGSFARLLEQAKAEYVMLCDQDDCWFADKVAVSLRRMRQCEEEFGTRCPILVHSDLVVADGELRPLEDSFWSYAGLDARQGGTLGRLLLQNVVTGCASIVNRALLEKALPVPPQAIVHDWWLALVATAPGRLEPLPLPTLLYRQHAHNAIGARRFGAARRIGWFFGLWLSGAAGLRVDLTRQQAAALAVRYGGELSERQRALLHGHSRLGDYSFFRRRWELMRLRALDRAATRSNR